MVLGLPWVQERTIEIRGYLRSFLLILQLFPPQERKETKKMLYAQVYKSSEYTRRGGAPKLRGPTPSHYLLKKAISVAYRLRK